VEFTHILSMPLARRSLAVLLLALAPCARAQRAPEAPMSAPISAIEYIVTADMSALAARRLWSTMSFDVADAGVVLLSLPAWTPGAYEISDFAKGVGNFSARQDGLELRWDKLDFDTWRVRPTRAGRITVRFELQADSLDNAMSWARRDFAMFNGTNLFLYPEGRSLEFASTVRIDTDVGRVVTGLTSAGSPKNFKAASYHELVDMPVFVGRFDLDSAIVAGKNFRYATYPAGAVSVEARATAWQQLQRIVPAELNVFGEIPWETYTLMQIVDSTSNGYSGLEHSNSHVDIVSPAFIGSDFQPSLYAHEIFHAWNVKRLRPADLVPYRYDRPQPTTWLWVSEGITDYYADLAEVRGGVIDAAGFYKLTAEKIAEINNTVPFALEDASLNTWIHPKDGTGYSYYPKGSLAGFLLDIMIRDATDNARSLDTVMRELYQTTYKKGRGFTREDFWGSIRKATGGLSFDDFERMYVDGREPYPWDTALKTIGLRLVPDSTPYIGVSTGTDAAGAVRIMQIQRDSPAEHAGVKIGDELLSIGDLAVADNEFGPKFRLRYAGRATGTPLAIVVKRGTESVSLPGLLGYTNNDPRLAEDPNATPKQVRLRNGILRGLNVR
jgi:predicted metalloprotease with PDZ domain